MTHFIRMTTAILFKLAVKQRTILLVVFATDGILILLKAIL